MLLKLQVRAEGVQKIREIFEVNEQIVVGDNFWLKVYKESVEVKAQKALYSSVSRLRKKFDKSWVDIKFIDI